MKHCPVLRFIFCISVIWWSFYEIKRKVFNTKSIALINEKTNHQQKHSFIICKQLNKPVLKSLKSMQSNPRSKKKLTGSDSSQKILSLLRAESKQDCGNAGRAQTWIIQPVQTSYIPTLMLAVEHPWTWGTEYRRCAIAVADARPIGH